MFRAEFEKLLKPFRLQSDFRDRLYKPLWDQIQTLGFTDGLGAIIDETSNWNLWYEGLQILARENPLLALLFVQKSVLKTLSIKGHEDINSELPLIMKTDFLTHQHHDWIGVADLPFRSLYFLTWSGKEFQLHQTHGPLQIQSMNSHPWCYKIFFHNIDQVKPLSLIKLELSAHLHHLLQSLGQVYLQSLQVILQSLQREAIDLVTKYSLARVQGGRPIIQWDEQHQRITNSLAEVEVLEGILECSNDLPIRWQFLFTSDLLKRTIHNLSEIMPLFGGISYLRDSKIEYLFRCSILLSGLMDLSPQSTKDFFSVNQIKAMYE